MSTVLQGRLTRWNDARAFGFIRPDHGGAEVFVHRRSFDSLEGGAQVGQRVSYSLTRDSQGRTQAQAVRVLMSPRRGSARADRGGAGPAARSSRVVPTRPANRSSGRGARWWGGAVLAAFVVLVGWVHAHWGLHPYALIWYGGWSVWALLAYAADKAAARAGRWRLSERSLLIWGLVGGWPGAWIAQRVLRHKSSKQTFQWMFWLSVLLNMAAFIAVHRPGG